MRHLLENRPRRAKLPLRRLVRIGGRTDRDVFAGPELRRSSRAIQQGAGVFLDVNLAFAVAASSSMYSWV